MTADGSHASFETSSFMSGTDADLDLTSETTTNASMMSLSEIRSDSGTPNLPLENEQGVFPCSICDKKFGSRRNMVSHLRRHNGDFKLFCEQCQKGFFTKSKLESHMRKHTGKQAS